MSIFTIKFDDIPVRGFNPHEFKSEVRASSGTSYAVVVKTKGQWFWRTLLVGGISDFKYRSAVTHACDVYERATGKRHPNHVSPVSAPPVTEHKMPAGIRRDSNLPGGVNHDFGLPGGRRHSDPPMQAARRPVPGRRGRIDELEDDDDLSLRVQLSRARNMESSYVDTPSTPSPSSCSPRSSHSHDSDHSTSRASCSGSSHSSHSSSSSDSSSSSSDSSSPSSD